MGAQYNAAEIERLVREAREDDEAIRTFRPICCCQTCDLLVEGHSEGCPAAPIDEARDRAERRARHNLRAMADQLEAARPFADLGRAYARMKELDEICEAHPRNGDAIGAAAESELADLVPCMRKMLDRIPK